MIVAPGSTSVSIQVQIVDDAGLPVTGLVAATWPATSYVIAGNAAVSITLADLGAANAAYSSGGVFELGGGYYRLDVPNAAFSSAGRVRIIGEATDKRVIYPPIFCQNAPADVLAWRGTQPLNLTSQLVQVNVERVLQTTEGASGLQGLGAYYDTNSVVPASGNWLTALGANAPAGWLNAAAFASGSLNGKGDWLLASSYTAPDNAGITSAASAASTAATNTSTILARIGAFTGTGINTILGFFKAALSKAAGTPSDIGGTFDASTDSLENIKDTGTGGGSPPTTNVTVEVTEVRAQ